VRNSCSCGDCHRGTGVCRGRKVITSTPHDAGASAFVCAPCSSEGLPRGRGGVRDPVAWSGKRGWDVILFRSGAEHSGARQV
jgi:hypothetical protein